MISINIAALHGKYLEEVLESIRRQSYDCYEVIVVNGSDNGNVSKLARDYGADEIVIGGSLLKARYAALTRSKGSHVFNLDETRPLSRNDALEMLSHHDSDMVFINEREVVKNLISKAADLDKEVTFSRENIMSLKPYVLPRFYNTEIYLKAIEEVKRNIGNIYERATILPEDLFIYSEARKLSNNISIEFTPLIKHYGDFALRDVIRKYYRYGKGYAFTSFTCYRDIGKDTIRERLSGRLKATKNFKELLILASFLGIKGVCGLMGETTEKVRIAVNLDKN